MLALNDFLSGLRQEGVAPHPSRLPLRVQKTSRQVRCKFYEFISRLVISKGQVLSAAALGIPTWLQLFMEMERAAKIDVEQTKNVLLNWTYS